MIAAAITTKNLKDFTCPENQALDDPAVIGVRQLTFKTTYDDDKIALNTMKTTADITNSMKYS